MTPIWNVQFWLDVIRVARGYWLWAFPAAGVSSFLGRLLNGTVSALDIDPVLLGIAVLAVMLDTGAGCYKAAKRDNFTFNGDEFGQIVDKIIKYAIVIVTFSAIAGAGEVGEFPEWAFAWIRDFGYMVVIVRDSFSAIENIWNRPIGELLPRWKDMISQVSE